MKPPSSNRQISTLINAKKGQLYYRLCMLLIKFIRSDNLHLFVYQLLSKDMTDMNYFDKMYPYIHKPTSGVNTYVVNTIVSLLNRLDIIPNTILDFGCGDCGIVESIGKEMKLGKSAIFGTDIKDTFEQSWDAARSDRDVTFKFTSFEKVVPFDKKFDVIMALMVFHHIENPKPIIKDLYDALIVGGVMIIREHDCSDKYDGIYADLVHSLFIVQNNGLDKEKILSQQNYYHSYVDWKQMIQDVGFTEIAYEPDINSPTKNYRAVYRK